MEITLIWSSDGWCYIPQLKIRQRFFENKQIQKETWDGIIAMPKHVETIPWTLFLKQSEQPEIWSQQCSSQTPSMTRTSL